MHALWHALVLAHQPHDNTYGLAATPDGQTVFVDSRHCIYRSQDAGDSWQKANGAGLPLVAGGALTHGGPSVIEVSHDFQDNGRVYLARDDKLFASHDGGASWSSTTLARGAARGEREDQGLKMGCN